MCWSVRKPIIQLFCLDLWRLDLHTQQNQDQFKSHYRKIVISTNPDNQHPLILNELTSGSNLILYTPIILTD
jgi:hypothetical protein